MRDIKWNTYTSLQEDKQVAVIPPLFRDFFVPLLEKVAQAAYEDGLAAGRAYEEDVPW